VRITEAALPTKPLTSVDHPSVLEGVNEWSEVSLGMFLRGGFWPLLDFAFRMSVCRRSLSTHQWLLSEGSVGTNFHMCTPETSMMRCVISVLTMQSFVGKRIWYCFKEEGIGRTWIDSAVVCAGVWVMGTAGVGMGMSFSVTRMG